MMASDVKILTIDYQGAHKFTTRQGVDGCCGMVENRRMSSKSIQDSAKEATVARALSQWFKKSARDLPWRRNPEPYWVWLSEVMLQQTQVATVLPYFDRFIKTFPTVELLAAASLDDIYRLWAGLGYYSRARNLHQGAITIAMRIQAGQGFPKNRAEWLEIPGVGEYTAGAVCSIAYDQPEAIVDGNVVRVLSRVYGIKKIDLAKTKIWERARQLVTVPRIHPRILNQAMMELGATICKSKNPNCSQCPVRLNCQGIRAPEKYPEPKAPKIWKKVQEQKWVLIAGDLVYLRPNPSGQWRAGLWDFPDAGTVNGVTEARLKGEFMIQYVVTTHKVSRKHQVFNVSGALPLGNTVGIRMKAPAHPDGKWISISNLPGVPAPVKRAIGKMKSF